MSGIVLRGKDAAAHAAGFNSWPTLKTQGVHVVELTDDFTRTVLRMDVTDENANYMGTAFGGSLFSMLDPFLVVMTINQLGPDYVVWDKAAEIEFVAPGVGSVHATIEMPEETVAEMREAAAGGKKVLRWFEVPITAEDGSVVANVRRQLYVRERRKDA